MARKSLSIDEILNMNKVDIRKSLPPNFPPPPPEVRDFKGNSEDEYKEYMKKKMMREQWENSLTLYRMREKEGDQAGMKAVVDRMNNTISISNMNEATSIDPKSKEARDMEAIMEEEFSGSDDGQPTQPPPKSHPRRDSPEIKRKKPDQPKIVEKQPKIKKEKPKAEKKAKEPSEPLELPGPLRTLCGADKRHYYLFPSQVLLVANICISCAVSNIPAAVICGIILSLVFAAFSSFIIWEKRHNAKKVSLLAFLVCEFFAFLFGLIGGFTGDRNFIFYLGIPAILLVIGATGIGWFLVIKQLAPLGKDAIAETF